MVKVTEYVLQLILNMTISELSVTVKWLKFVDMRIFEMFEYWHETYWWLNASLYIVMAGYWVIQYDDWIQGDKLRWLNTLWRQNSRWYTVKTEYLAIHSETEYWVIHGWILLDELWWLNVSWVLGMWWLILVSYYRVMTYTIIILRGDDWY